VRSTQRNMPYTLNGIGTRYYGQRDFGLDETYTTTEWVTILYVPIVPIRSLRVRKWGSESTFVLGPGTSTSYSIHKRMRPHLKQVFYTYGFVALLAAWTAFVWSFSLNFKSPTAGILVSLLAPLVPAPIPAAMRQYAKPY
jgi:hypothetical protein